MICNVSDLSPDQKSTIETLLGRRVQEGEAVSFRTFEPVAVPQQRKLEIARELKKYFLKWMPPASLFQRKRLKRSSLRP